MKYLRDEPLSNHTTFKIGGPASLFCQPETIEDFASALALAKQERLKVFVLGNGSNVLMPDDGWPGLVIKLAGGLDRMAVSGQYIIAGAGASVAKLVATAAEHSLSGLEFMAGVPGTVGGAVFMNVGAWQQTFGTFVQTVRCIDLDGRQSVLSAKDLAFGYRDSQLQSSGLFALEATLKLNPGDAAQIKTKIRRNIQAREAKQPLNFPSAGSVFKNPANSYAAKLIAEAGCKGLRVNDAQVSDKHANFIVNLGKATAADVKNLITQVQDKVRDQFNIRLEPEIRIVVN